MYQKMLDSWTMSYNRRAFLKNTSLALTGAALLPHALQAATGRTAATGLDAARAAAEARPAATRLAIQLYTIRDDMRADPLGTLKQLSAMGYRHVEHANYINRRFYGYEAGAFRKVLDDLGLTMPSGHTELKESDHWDASRQDFTDVWKQTLEDAKIAGQDYVICPWLDESLRGDYDRLSRWLEVFNKSGALCKSQGLQFGYHNHDFEFKDRLRGKTLYDIILAGTDARLVAQQLDIGNMLGGGAKPMDVLRQYPGRFALMHVKDLIPATGKGEMNDPYESTILGQGILDTKTVVRAAVAAGTTQLTIEQESYQGRKPLDDTRKDLEVMRHWGF